MNQTGDQNVEATVDVGAQRVARVYAEALLNAAEKRGQAAEILEQLDSLVRDVLSKDPQLEAFLSSHAVGRDRAVGLTGDLCSIAMARPARQPSAVRQASAVRRVRLVLRRR